eukprot:jgi/Chlat1/9240/Chrsp99S09292
MHNLPINPHEGAIHHSTWDKRPLTNAQKECAAADVRHLLVLHRRMEESYIDACAWRVIDKSTALISPEANLSAVRAPPGIDLLLTFNESYAAVYKTAPRECNSSMTGSDAESNDVKETNSESPELASLLQVLPAVLKEAVAEAAARAFSVLVGEVVLDVGRRPVLRMAGKLFVSGQSDGCEDQLRHDVRVDDAVVAWECHGVRFSSANRAGVSGTLHRISAIQGFEKIEGLTYRIGRHVHGTAGIIMDFTSRLMPTSQSLAPDAMLRSILLLGAPGVGKTTLLRDIARITSETLSLRVVVVDTTNEIAGEEPHPCIGRARRMPVIDRKLQHDVLLEAVQNHNPQVILVDEISNNMEVQAVQTIAPRGIAMVATAHGLSLSGLLKNPVLRPLVGGVQFKSP